MNAELLTWAIDYVRLVKRRIVDIEKSIGQKLLKKLYSSRLRKILSLQRKLDKFILREKEKEVLEISLRFRKEYKGFYDYIRQSYFNGLASKKEIKPFYWALNDARRSGIKKIERTFNLEGNSLNLLFEVEPWYKKLFERYPNFESVRTQIKNFRHTGKKHLSPLTIKAKRIKELKTPL